MYMRRQSYESELSGKSNAIIWNLISQDTAHNVGIVMSESKNKTRRE